MRSRTAGKKANAWLQKTDLGLFMRPRWVTQVFPPRKKKKRGNSREDIAREDQTMPKIAPEAFTLV